MSGVPCCVTVFGSGLAVPMPFADLVVSYGSGDSVALQSQSSTYLPDGVRAHIYFAGTENAGEPVAIRVVANVADANDPGDIRIQDITNGNTIAEITGITATAPTIFDLGPLSDLSVDEADWEVQMRVPSNAIFVYTIGILG